MSIEDSGIVNLMSIMRRTSPLFVRNIMDLRNVADADERTREIDLDPIQRLRLPSIETFEHLTGGSDSLRIKILAPPCDT